MRTLPAVILFAASFACFKPDSEEEAPPDEEEVDAGPGTGPFAMTLSADTAPGAYVSASDAESISPALGAPWTQNLTPAVYQANLSKDGAVASSRMELTRASRSFTVHGTVSGSTPGNGVTVSAIASLGLVNVCVTEPAARAFRFVYDCSGTVTWNGDSGLASVEAKNEMKQHCLRMLGEPIDLPWASPDGASAEFENVGGSGLCRELALSVSAGAGSGGSTDNHGTATADASIKVTVESLY